jgi:phosphate/sulfate permease
LLISSFTPQNSNDVANAIAPFAAMYAIYTTNEVVQNAPVPWWILLLGAFGIVVGLATYGKSLSIEIRPSDLSFSSFLCNCIGYRVIETIGTSLTKITPSRGFSSEISTAITVVLASRLSIPVSTTHCQVGAVCGVGLLDGHSAIQWNIFMKILLSWVVTLPFAGVVSAALYLMLRVSV